VDLADLLRLGGLPALRQGAKEPEDLAAGGVEARAVATLPERRCDRVPDDAACLDVGEATLDASAHLDADASVLQGDDHEDAVVLPLRAELPGLGGPHRERLDGLPVEGLHDEVLELRAVAPVQRPCRAAEALEPRGPLGIEHAGPVHDRARERRHRHLGSDGPRETEQQAQGRPAAGAHAPPP